MKRIALPIRPVGSSVSECCCRNISSILFGWVPLMLLVLVSWGCGARSQQRAYEYMPDMVRDPAYKAFAPNPVTRDGLTMERPVAGTIARDYQPFHYGAGEQEASRAGSELQNPYGAIDQTQDGKALYETYCAVCHGVSGEGNGPIAEKIPHPPSFKSDRLLQFQPGRFFHVITMGSRKMPSYAAQLSASERWKVIAYVRRSLQGLQEERTPVRSGARP
jgi:mono/diheme cytochrome c family protein